jgi:hypothetical protein
MPSGEQSQDHHRHRSQQFEDRVALANGEILAVPRVKPASSVCRVLGFGRDWGGYGEDSHGVCRELKQCNSRFRQFLQCIL